MRIQYTIDFVRAQHDYEEFDYDDQDDVHASVSVNDDLSDEDQDDK